MASQDSDKPAADNFLLRFPPEILAEIVSRLPNSDIKSLRRTCSRVCGAVELRLDRVFLSANPLNIKVFCCIANHDKYRRAVREIIYDDARFNTDWIASEADKTSLEATAAASSSSPSSSSLAAAAVPLQSEMMYRRRLRHNGQQQQQQQQPLLTEEQRRARRQQGAKHMARARSQQNNEVLRQRQGRDSSALPQHARRRAMAAAQTTWGRDWRVYAALARQQVEVVDAAADATVLARALQLGRFPNLVRVSVTPAAHGFLYTPLYETPMIRALPYGFNYPLPRGWPYLRLGSIADTEPWVAGPEFDEVLVGVRKQRWRGLLVVFRTLADALRRQQQRKKKKKEEAEEEEEKEVEEKSRENGKEGGQGFVFVPELVMDVHGLNSGLNPHMFGQSSAEYADMATILEQPGFRRLDLPLLFGGMADERWEPLANGWFRALLARAADLEHFRLVSDTVVVGSSSSSSSESESESESGSQLQQPAAAAVQSTRHIPLDRMLPLHSWKKLTHFGLSRVPVRVDDLVGVLAALSPSLRSVELSFLAFVQRGDGYRRLLREMKKTMAAAAAAAQRNGGPPLRVVIGLPLPLPATSTTTTTTTPTTPSQSGRGLWLSREVSAFLYGDGENPFLADGGGGGGGGCVVDYGVGVARDEYENEFERPFLRDGDMVKLGIYAERGK